ncbi:unnamed protein product [Ilex paraguariensis]|uniref:Dof zinc finger protein n=1 Tax=Ilex paraguariensis TaxID=185542 RepID=A0ABC8S6U3_9AQUA
MTILLLSLSIIKQAPSTKTSPTALCLFTLGFNDSFREEMPSNCEKKMTVISSATNEWLQAHSPLSLSSQIDEKTMMASPGMAMEKQTQEQQQPPLKCPRCDSSNTKFCYFNNYSLSQPRHFCKACKRYWTRGGTLRNVPVGGGCRKNKKVRRAAIDAPSSSTSACTATSNPSVLQTQMDLSSSTSNHINPLFYSLPSSLSELNLPYSRFNSRVSNADTVSGYDLQPQLNAIGLGFPSGVMGCEVDNYDYRNGFNPNSLLSSLPVFGSSISTSTSTMASSRKLISGNFQGLQPYEDLNMPGNSEGRKVMREVKIEEDRNRLDWNIHSQNQIEQISSDPSLSWNMSVGAWLDPTNLGSSVPSQI